ncbi:hypothetical protein JCM9279_007365 [Rhodotorula babjevae]
MHPHHPPHPGDPPPPPAVAPDAATSGSRGGRPSAYEPARAHDAYSQQYSGPLYTPSELPVPLYRAAESFPSSTSGSTTSAHVAAHQPPPFSNQLGTTSESMIYTPYVAHLPPSPPLAHVSPADLASSTIYNPFVQPLAPPAPLAPHTHISPFDVGAHDSASYGRGEAPLGRQSYLDPVAQPTDDASLRPPPSTARRRASQGTDLEVGGSVRGLGGRGGGRSQGHAHGSSAGGSGSATAAAAGSGGASRASVSALAAAVGARTTEKSCKNCRVRKVKCDRRWPRCNRCKDRDDECDFGTFVPVDAIPESALANATSSPTTTSGTAALQARIAELEQELAVLRTDPPLSRAPVLRPSAIHNVSYGTSSGVVPSSSSSLETLGAWSDAPGAAGVVSAFPRSSMQALDELSGNVSLSETIHDAFARGAGFLRPGSTASKTTVEIFLRGAALQDPGLYAAASAGLAPLSGPVPTGSGQVAPLAPTLPRESDPNWQLAKSAMARMLVVHLVQAFFASCCAYLPAFNGWHPRRSWILQNLDNIDPASRVSVAAFCAMGARASQHSAILGISMPEPTPDDWFEHTSAAGVRREQACRALHSQALDLAHLLGVTYEASRENLEALMVVAQLLIFNELIPRRSRAIVHTALGQYKELQEGPASADQKDHTLKHVGLPLLACDAQTSASARKRPLVSPSELAHYFPNLLPADPLHDDIQRRLQQVLDDTLMPDGQLSHEGIVECTHVINSWLVQTERLFAQAAAPVLGGPPMSLINDVRNQWLLLDGIHEAIRRMQELLVHLEYMPSGCSRDKCADQHLRFITRLDLDLLNCFFLLHSLVTENLGLDHLTGDNAVVVYAESDKRIRKALKLIAFYLELYIMSRDPHLTYHVVWQLEVIPNWPSIVVQRFGEQEGPSSPDLEVSDVELDWLDKGLVCASYYHPVASSRLHELRAMRRPAAGGPPSNYPPPHAAPMPPTAPEEASASIVLPVPMTDVHALSAVYFPGTTTYLAGDETVGEGAGMPFQVGVTDPAHLRPWGMWSGSQGESASG